MPYLSRYESVDFQIARQAKTCGQCKEYKNFSEFHKHSVSRTGVHSICKSCRSFNAYQAQLSKRIENKSPGYKSIRNCITCDRLFSEQDKNIKECKICRNKKD